LRRPASPLLIGYQEDSNPGGSLKDKLGDELTITESESTGGTNLNPFSMLNGMLLFFLPQICFVNFKVIQEVIMSFYKSICNLIHIFAGNVID
jgi:hypothetical protein